MLMGNCRPMPGCVVDGGCSPVPGSAGSSPRFQSLQKRKDHKMKEQNERQSTVSDSQTDQTAKPEDREKKPWHRPQLSSLPVPSGTLGGPNLSTTEDIVFHS